MDLAVEEVLVFEEKALPGHISAVDGVVFPVVGLDQVEGSIFSQTDSKGNILRGLERVQHHNGLMRSMLLEPLKRIL